jgi:hypothetical protein
MGALDKKTFGYFEVDELQSARQCQFPSGADLQTRAMAYLGATAAL